MKYIEIVLVSLGLIYGIAFGSSSLTNKGNNHYNIYYDNIQYTDNIQFYGVNGLSLQYAGQLATPGDFYELSFDVVNDSEVDVEISNCTYQTSDYYIDYQLTYDDGKDILVGDILEKGEKRRIKYRVLYKNLIDSNYYEWDSSFHLSYEQVL